MNQSVFDLLCDGSSSDQALERRTLQTMIENFSLWKQRHAKYGPENIGALGALGCFVRSFDKLARLKQHYVKHTPADFADDSLIDAWRDLANYAVMGLMCHQGAWPGTMNVYGERGGEELLDVAHQKRCTCTVCGGEGTEI